MFYFCGVVCYLKSRQYYRSYHGLVMRIELKPGYRVLYFTLISPLYRTCHLSLTYLKLL